MSAVILGITAGILVGEKVSVDWFSFGKFYPGGEEGKVGMQWETWNGILVGVEIRKGEATFVNP